MRVLVLNGPNLNLLGRREPEVYGSDTLEDLENAVVSWAESLGVEVDHLQTNHEGELVEAIQGSSHDGIVINPGALTHTSRALADAIAAVRTPTVEVHISNVLERETWRAQSVLRGIAVLSVYGRGFTGYRDALRHLVNRSRVELEEIRYGPHPDQVGDLRRAGNDLVVLIHGGFWRHEWTRDTMETLAVDLHQEGLSTWNIEYRRIGTGGGWPGSAHDVSMALDFARQANLASAGMSVVGHSAGGHLAIWASSKGSTPDLIVAMAPVTNLSKHALSGLFGSTESRSLLDRGAPSSLHPGDVPVVLVHGQDDSQVPIEHSTELAERNDLVLHRVSGGHFELLDPSHEHWKKVVEVVSNC